MRLLIADDSALLRHGLASLVIGAGHDVVAMVADGEQLDHMISKLDPPADIAILDIRMPPTNTDEGARAAVQLRINHPDVGILLLSQHVEAHHVMRLMREHPAGFGYLLKDRVLDIEQFLDAIERVAAGGFVVDPDVVHQLLLRSGNRDALARLTPQESRVLTLIAEGLANAAIGARLKLSGKTVENHISSIFAKLDLTETPGEHRRVRAVLLLLAHRAASLPPDRGAR